MKRFYIPFEHLTGEIIRDGIDMGKFYWIIQRFPWPGGEGGIYFMATPYADEGEARTHEAVLDPGEGKLMDMRTAISRIEEMLHAASRYKIFVNTHHDPDWSKTTLRTYRNNITSFMRSQHKMKVDRDAGVDITFTFRFGRLIAKVISGDSSAEFYAYDMIK
jgi:hypothetical protein